MFDKPILNHAEVRELTHGGVMHEGLVSLVLGLPGMPAAAEDVMVGRDIALADATGGRIHMMHVSSAGSVELIRRAKGPRRAGHDRSLPASFHAHRRIAAVVRLEFQDEPAAARASSTSTPASPAWPMARSTCIVHRSRAARALEKKMLELDQAPFGIVGLETALGLVMTRLIEPGILDWPTALAKMTINPARILGIDKGTLAIGADADVTIIDPEVRWIVDPARFRSKSAQHTIWRRHLQGRADTVIVGGRIKHQVVSDGGEQDTRPIAAEPLMLRLARGLNRRLGRLPMAIVIDGYNLLHASGILGRGIGPGGLERWRRRCSTFWPSRSKHGCCRAPPSSSTRRKRRGLAAHRRTSRPDRSLRRARLGTPTRSSRN